MEEPFPLMDFKTLVGKGISIGQLSLYPVARLSILKAIDESIQSFWISPIAFIVTGPGFDVPLTLSINNEKFDLENLELPLDLRKSLDSRRREKQ